jgi:hypothetical protein
MKRSFLELYALAICLFVFIAGCATAYDNVDKLLPAISPMLAVRVKPWQYERYQSNKKYVHLASERRATELRTMSDEAITKEREDGFNNLLRDEAAVARYKIIESLLKLLVISIIWWVHWRLAKKARLASEQLKA